MSIDLRSGTGAFGAVVETVFALRSTLSDGQLPEISEVRPVRSYTNQAAGFHRQSVALQALRGSSPMKCKNCERALKMIDLYLSVYGGAHIDFRSLLEDIRIILKGEDITSFRRLIP